MSDYSNTFGGAAKDSSNATILGAQFDTEFDGLATMSSTKANKVTSPTANLLLMMDGTGDLAAATGWSYDSGNMNVALGDVELRLGARASDDGDPNFRLSTNDDGAANTLDAWLGKNVEMNAGIAEYGRSGEGITVVGFKGDASAGELFLGAGPTATAGDAAAFNTSITLDGGATERIDFTLDGTDVMQIFDTSVQVDGNFQVDNGDVIILEQADHTSTPAAGRGYMWVRSDAPNTLMYTDDAANDYEVAGELSTKRVSKSADESVTSSTVEQDDDHLTIAVEANSTYEVDLLIEFDFENANDLKYELGVPAGAVCYGIGQSHSSTSGGTEINRLGSGGATETCSAGNTNDPVVLHLKGMVTVAGTAGNATFRWAQSASSATACTVRQGSTMTLTKTS